MNKFTSTVGPHREKADIFGGISSYSPPWRRAPITKIAGVLIVVIAAAFVTDMISTRILAVDATIKSYAAKRGAAHVVVDGLFIAIPNNLARSAVENVIALP
jgi:hypothetical protein